MKRSEYRPWGWMQFRAVARQCTWAGLGLLAQGLLQAQVPEGAVPQVPVGFELTRWAREPMLRSPVALSFDDLGRLYVVETARRGSVDIDIRSHADWLLDDLASQSTADLRRYFRQRMAPERSAENAGWLRDLNGDGSHDWRDLMQVKERVHRLEDRSGSGRADHAQVFFEGFHEEITGVVAGVMPWGRDVFVTVYPDLWRLQDADGDGVAERQEVVAHGFGVHAAFDGHDLHGLTEGPDGKVYFSVGDNGFSVTNREGRRLHYPNTGGVLRMNADGSDLEVFATGLRNPQEIAFDEFGNWFSVDNDGDLKGERERFVFIAEGSDAGWRLHWQFRDTGWARQTRAPDFNPWTDERLWVPHFDGQPAHIVPPITNYSVGPGSFKFNPGTALHDRYVGHFFLIQFPVARVTAFRAVPRGAGFEMADEHTFLSGMMASAVNFGPDGALYVGDWDGMWSPSGKGSIWRVDDPKNAGSPVRSEVRRRLREGFASAPSELVLRALGHADQRIRLRAQSELVRRGAMSSLRTVAASLSEPLLARVHALWALGQAREVAAADLFPWNDAEVQVRAQSAKVAGDLRAIHVVERLESLLSDAAAPVRYQAAIALGKLGRARSLPSLVALVARDAALDPVLRHAGICGLAGVGTEAELSALSRHASPAVRVAAVVALRRQRSPAVAVFLTDVEPGVRAEAVRALHDDGGIPGAESVLAPLLGAWPGADEGIVRRLMNANLRQGTSEAAGRLLRYALEGSHAERMRVEAVECLADWTTAPAMDRVEGFVRSLDAAGRDAQAGRRALEQGFRELAAVGGQEVPGALVKAVLEYDLDVDAASFVLWGLNDQRPGVVRARVLEWLARRDPPRLKTAMDRAWKDPEPAVREMAMRLDARRDAEGFLRRVVVSASEMPIPDRQRAYALAALLPETAAADWIRRSLVEFEAGALRAELVLDVLEAARQRAEPEFRARLERIESRWPAADPLARHRVALAGGDARRGEEIFRHHPNAQCVRCHDAGGEGQQVGPMLGGVATRLTADQLLEAIVEPSARIADGYAVVSVELSDGSEYDGVRLAETDAEFTLRLANGEVKRIVRREIRRQSVSTVSSMPPMGTVLTPFEIRDLIAYLTSLK